MVMFDLPTQTKEQRRFASQYRNMLMDYGFTQIQFSVYAKYLINATGLKSIVPQLKSGVPTNGEVRAIRLTDEQWAGTFRWYGPKDEEVEKPPPQLLLFE
jgi:CRISPR-associated protein Cas2